MKFLLVWLALVVLWSPLAQADDFVASDEDDLLLSADVLTLDADDTAGNVQLQFGGALAETLAWDSGNARFSFSDSIDLQGHQLVDARLENLAAAPTCDGSAIGRVYHNSTDNNTYVCNGTIWEQIDGGGASGGSLDAGYDDGGAGAGRTVTVDSGAVQLQGTGTVLELGDNTANNFTLSFNDGAARTLTWNNTDSEFEFSESVDLQGNQLVNTRAENLALAPICDPANAGRIYFNTVNSTTYVCNGTIFAQIENTTSGAVEFAAVQARRTTSYALTTTFTDINLDTTDVENSPAVVEHDNTNTDRILINEGGLYQVIYSFTSGATALLTHEAFGRVRVNDTTVVPGSEAVNKNFQNEYSTTSSSFIANFATNDFLSLQLSRDPEADSTQGDIFFSIMKIEGVKGDPGPAGADGVAGAPGADGDITWEGDWVAQNYTANQAVSYLGSSYVCILNTVSNELPTNPTYWNLLAAKGDPGAGGGAGTGTNENIFTLDEDNTGGDVSLVFGSTLSEHLTWDETNNRFNLSDDLRTEGDLEQTGTILTLDADNTGAGANTDIVSEQGSDSNGTLRYDATENRWQLNNNSTGFENITSIYGTEFNVFESTGVSTNTTTTFNDKINTSTSVLPVGTYKVQVSYSWNVDSTGSDFISRLFFDGANVDAANNNEMHRQEGKDSAGAFGATGTSQKHGFTKTYFVSVGTAGAKTIQLQWAAESGGTETSIWNANLEVIRVQ